MPGADGSTRAAVLDASVAVRWVITEVGSERAAALLDEPFRWCSPRLMLTELASALRRKVSEARLSPHLAMEALDAILTEVANGRIELAAEEEVMPLALSLALSLGHKMPDCVYLALAERRGAELVTADRQLASLADARSIAHVLVASA